MSKNISAALAAVLFIALAIYAFNLSKKSPSNKTLKVLAYSSFLTEWGPAKELADIFEKQTGIHIDYQDGDDAGILLTKLNLFPSDVVVGLDRFGILDAKKKFKWKSNSITQSEAFADPEFVAFDWAPLAFIYRTGEVEPPKNFDDLLSARFKGSISLEDPRTSSPGLQFLYWLAIEKGDEAKVAEYLQKLKPNIRAVSPSWSTAYGLFQKGQAKLAFSYLTSPVYHWQKDKNLNYRPAVFDSPHISQIEYAGVPESCVECESGEQFLKFLISADAQKIIMNKNVMLPVSERALMGTDFEKLPKVQLIKKNKLEAAAAKKESLLLAWRSANL